MGRVTLAKCVHHARPVETAPTPAEMRRLMFDPGNLQCLCEPCHTEVHAEMGKSTREESARRRRAESEAAIKSLFG